MADLKMKLNTNNVIRLKVNSNDPISMKFDDYQKFKEEDPIFTNSPAFKITNSDIYNWNHKSDFDGNYDSLTNKPNLTIYATRTWVTEGLNNKVDKETGMGLSQNSFTTEEKNKLASLENYDDTAIVNELANKADISSIPTKLSDLDNDEGFITKDVDDLTNYPTNDSVNAVLGEKQNIIDSENMLSSDLVDDTSSTNKFVTASDITAWNNKSDFSGDYNDLTNKPTIPTKTSELTNDSGYVTNTYSSSEIECGKWINGEKIYRSVFSGTTGSSTTQINLSSLNIKRIINISGTVGPDNDSKIIPFVLESGGTVYFISARYSLGTMYLSNSGAYANLAYYLVVEYTKSS